MSSDLRPVEVKATAAMADILERALKEEIRGVFPFGDQLYFLKGVVWTALSSMKIIMDFSVFAFF